MFGLSKNDLKTVSNKLKSQEKYLDSNFFTTGSGQVKSLKDVSFSANHSERYYAQLSNRIDTMTKMSISEGLHSCFLTMTLDGYFRDLIHGDYTRFDLLEDEDRRVALQSVPNSEILGEVRQKIERREILTIKDLYNILNHQTKRYLQSYAFKKLKKQNQKYMYIRTVEPHKDGVPHFHMMLYIPFEHINQFKKDFIKSYPAPQNRRIKNTKKYIVNYIVDDIELEGFQTDIRDTTAYIMKYILKSFMDVKKQKEVDYIQAWYIKHRLMRCVSSRSLVPQWVYQKASIFEKDWYHLTDIMNDPANDVEWSKEDNYFYFIDNHTKRELVYSFGVYSIVYEGRVIKEVGEPIEKNHKTVVYDKIPTKWVRDSDNLVDFRINNKGFHYLKSDLENHNQGNEKLNELGIEPIPFSNILRRNTIKPYQMSDADLYTYFHKLDIETVDYSHYMHTRNLLIDRGYIEAIKLNLNHLDTLNNYFESESKF